METYEQDKINDFVDYLDEDIQLQRSEYIGQILDEMLFEDGNFEKLLSMLVSQSPDKDDMVTAKLRLLYNDAVQLVAQKYSYV